jgi:hypothetical protein
LLNNFRWGLCLLRSLGPDHYELANHLVESPISLILVNFKW